VETNWLQAAIDQNGGNLARLKLKKHLYNGEPLPLLENEARLYVAQSGLIGEPDAPNHNSAYALAAAPANNPQADFITVAASAQGGGLQLVKRYVFAQNGYVASLLLEARNTGAEAKEPLAYFQLAHDGAPPRNYSSLLPTFFGVAMYTNEDKFVKFDFDEIGDSPYPRKTNNGWLGIIQRYFAVVWLPPAGEREFFMRKASAGGARVGFIAPFGSIAPGQTKTVTARLFAGAQEQDVLGRLQDDNVAPGINLVVDYGWLTFIAVLLFDMLSFIHQYVGNWGVAIVLLTFAVKLLFYPLSSAAYRSMAKMKEEAPRLKQLQEKYANDKQRMQREMMAIYREKKINPLGGCLPILVQIPVFIALYWVLLGSVELRQAPFFFWITDLSTPDPYYILSLVMGVAMFLQTRLSPAPPDPTQALIMKLMPIGFALFSVFFPSGLVLYWAVNTILSIAQQWHITRAIAKKGKGGQ
jgi:YidC/Oxa1 family membrane protein insertase